MSQQKKLPEPARIVLTMMTAAMVFFWLVAMGMQWVRFDRKAWYDFPLSMTIIYTSAVLCLAIGWGVWKFTERFK